MDNNDKPNQLWITMIMVFCYNSKKGLKKGHKQFSTYVYNSNHILTEISKCQTPGDLRCFYNSITILGDGDENIKLYLWNSSLRDSFSMMKYLGSFNGSSKCTYLIFDIGTKI
ncbi:hypothetical protein ACB092_M009500 [Castanea dentata]